MMNLILVGLNHKTAPIEVREKFFCSAAQQELFLSELKSHALIVEAVVLSTCNRTEIYTHALDAQQAPEELLRVLFQIKGLKLIPSLRRHFYVYSGEEAVRHFFRVTSGLDSMILGEKQILGQVKEAIELARKKTMLGKHFNILSNVAVRTGKKAHSETEISFGGCSLSWAGVVTAERILNGLKGKSVLIIGAGKMSELTLEHMKKKGVGNIYVMNRTESCALELARRCSGEAVSFADIKETLSKVDVCICSVGAPHYILDKSTVDKIMDIRHYQKLIFIDISMPRNIDPQIATIDNVLLFHLDDLDKVVGDTMRKREAAVIQVEKIISDKTSQFKKKISALERLGHSDYREPAKA